MLSGVLCTLASPAAAQIYVAAGASGDGSAASPFGHIQQAINVAAPGDTILVGPGTYSEAVATVTNGSASLPIALKANGSAGAVLVTSSGRVLTVKLGIDDGRSTAGKHLSTSAIEMAAPGDVIVVEQRTGMDAAAWGGNLSLGAKMRGVAGVICEGPARDIDESRQHDFPVYARDHTCTTARGRLVEVSTNERVTVGSILVSAGDYVIADASAVVFFRQADIARGIETAEKIVEVPGS